MDTNQIDIIRKQLSFFRWHTAALTIPGFLIGVYAAGIQIFSLDTLYWIIAGWLFHATGFAHNNLTDYEFDIHDKSKAHHPLVSGYMRLSTAYGIVYIMFFLSTAWIVWLIHNSIISIVLLIISVLSGVGYNYLCKKHLISPLLISICFGLLPGISFFSYISNATIGIILIIMYAFFQILFQISVEGYIKDIEHDPVNLYRRFGCYVKNNKYVATLSSQIYGYTIKLPMLLLGLLIIMYYSAPVWGIVSFLILFLLTMYSVHYLLKNKDWNRNRVVKMCAITEIITYFALIFACAGVYGMVGVIFLVVFPLSWFMFWNKVFWGTVIEPKV